jgi:hypothetical protein
MDAQENALRMLAIARNSNTVRFMDDPFASGPD